MEDELDRSISLQEVSEVFFFFKLVLEGNIKLGKWGNFLLLL